MKVNEDYGEMESDITMSPGGFEGKLRGSREHLKLTRSAQTL